MLPPPKSDPGRTRWERLRALRVLWLREIEGNTVPEVAAAEDCSERTVQRAQALGRELVPPRVVEALKRLAAELAGPGS
jgi:DNA-directed RNA polymerase specialized sigma24 family protein